MTSKPLETIIDHIANKPGFAYFRPEPGPLRERLTRLALDSLPPEQAQPLSQRPLEIEVSVGRQEGDAEATLEFRVDDPQFGRPAPVALELLSEAELADLAAYLPPRTEQSSAPVAAPDGELATQQDGTGHHLQASAAARLKVSPEWLKSVVPCTDYSYEEIDGKKYIREYFWSRELIERLFRIKSSKTTPEDLQYVAKECCDGDLDWAKDLIARLKSPNRPEAAREQQKGHGKSAQVKASPKAGPVKPPQGQGKQGAPKPQQHGKPAPAAAAGVAGANGGAAATGGAAGAEGEKPRSRSRHRKPFRHHGKDGSRKPESPAGPKSSQP
jgi:hypothetical protein